MAFSHCHSFGLVQSPRRAFAVSASVGTATPTAVDCGRVLGVRPNASKCEVKAAFRKLALRYHPDICNGDECGVDFIEVNKAYESLMTLSYDQGQEREVADSPQDGDGGSLREDYSSYYSNLKYYSKASRKRRYTGASQYYK